MSGMPEPFHFRSLIPDLRHHKQPGCPILFRALCEKGLPCFAEAPSEAEGEAEGVGFHSRLPHGIFRASRPAFFITFFLYRPHRHRIAIRTIIHRQYSIENSARLQRRIHHPPQNHLRRLFEKWTIKQYKRQLRTPKSARQTAETRAKSLFM